MNDYFFLMPHEWESKIDVLLPHLTRPDQPIILFVSGSASTGKSSVSIELCHLLGIRNYISTDTLRYVLASKENGKPLLQYFSHECWKYYNEYSEQNMILGFRKQSELVCDAVDVMLQDASRHKKNTIIEGIHLLPSIILRRKEDFPELKMVFIFLTTDYDHFVNVLLPNRVASSYRHRTLSEYDQNRLSRFLSFQKMWATELEEYGVSYIKNCLLPSELIGKILDQLIMEIEG